MGDVFSLSAYDYELPGELIAQHPSARRDESRLMVPGANPSGGIRHLRFSGLPSLLKPGDCLVMNNTRVFPARLHGRRNTGGRVEFFLLHFPEATGGKWRARALTRSSKSLRRGETVRAGSDLDIEVIERRDDGSADILLHTGQDIATSLETCGETPLPPYIRRTEREPSDVARYQTVYARETGSVAAPTAGLHFTDILLEEIRSVGVKVAEVTLHVGYGTFAPVRTEDIREHKIHSEYVVVPEETCLAVNSARAAGRRVVAVGTTSVRSLEWASCGDKNIGAKKGECSLYIMPGFRFSVVDCMITNFHLPRSSLLILVSAFAGRENILAAYREAVREKYRFYSYGDAMFLERN